MNDILTKTSGDSYDESSASRPVFQSFSPRKLRGSNFSLLSFSSKTPRRYYIEAGARHNGRLTRTAT